MTGRIFKALSFAGRDALYLIDSKPVPVCHPIHQAKVRLLRDDGVYWGKARIRRSDALDKRELISNVRQRIETLFSQFCRNFIDKAFSRSWTGFYNTIKLKLIRYNLRQFGFLSS